MSKRWMAWAMMALVCAVRAERSRAAEHEVALIENGQSSYSIVAPDAPDPHYLALLPRYIADSATLAFENLQPARIGAASGNEDSSSHYRRVQLKAGHVRNTWMRLPPEDVVGPVGEIDPELGVLLANSPAGEALAVVFNYSLHANRHDRGGMIDGSYPVRVAQRLEAELGGKTVLYLIDGLYGGYYWEARPYKWNMPPFNGDWPSSILASQDPVAIDSVGYDFVNAEWPDVVRYGRAPAAQYDMGMLETGIGQPEVIQPVIQRRSSHGHPELAHPFPGDE